MIQIIAQGLLFIYVFFMPLFLYMGYRASKDIPSDGTLIDKVVRVTSITTIGLFWPVYLVRALTSEFKDYAVK